MRWDRRLAFLLGLTGAAGALDALAFLGLGKVFTSFQSGNVLFLGIGAGRGDWGLVLRAGVVLLAFVAGTAAGARVVGSRLQPRGVALEVGVVGAEIVLLLGFAVLWLALGDPGDHRVWRIVLLVVGATAMGAQAALALALKVPNVLTVALTATIAEVGRRLGLGRRGTEDDPDRPASSLLLVLIATYAACAVVVAALRHESWIALLPATLLAAGLALDVRQAAARRARIAGDEDRRAGRRADQAPVRGRRPALPEAAGRSGAGGGHRGP